MSDLNVSSENLFQLLVESIKSPSAIVDEFGQIIITNENYSKHELKEEFDSFFNRFLSQRNNNFSAILKLGNRTIDVSHFELFLEKKYFLVLFNSEGQNQVDSKLKNLNHDLNNILTSILNSALLAKNYIKDDKTKKLIRSIEINTLRAASILDSSLHDENKIVLSKVEINLSNLIRELTDSLKYFSNKKIEFRLNDNGRDFWINGNIDNIYRAFQNVLVNAIEAIKQIGTIEISFESVKNFVCVKITDNGIGIKKSDVKKIFEKEYSTKKRKRESGLGLNIVKDIIEKHSGYIEVDSVYGIGTEFRIFLPEHYHEQSKTKSKAITKKIIIADDDENILQILQELLTSCNYTVFPARNGNEVLEILDKEEIEVIIIDRKMPQLDGLECIRKINSKKYTGKIILTTGSPGIKYDEKMIKTLGIYKLLLKPYDFNNLLEII